MRSGGKRLLGKSDFKPEVMDSARAVADQVQKMLPADHRFLLLVSTVGEGGRTYYLSNIARESSMSLLEEHLANMRANAPGES